MDEEGNCPADTGAEPGQPMVVRSRGFFRADDRCVRADTVEIQFSTRVPGDSAGGGTPVPDILPDGNLAEAGAVLHDGADRYEMGEVAGDRRREGIDHLRGGSR